MEEIPFTEQSNPLTYNIDSMNINDGMLDVLQEADLQIFEKNDNAEFHILDEKIILKIANLATKMTELMESSEGKSKIIFSGCGTSGRLGFIASRKFNQICEDMEMKPLFDYSIAGGDKALLESQESFEDEAIYGETCLKETLDGVEKSILIGISCGLSAAFVAGQIDFALQGTCDCFPVLLGFNPVNMARKHKMHNWHSSFHDVALKLTETNSIFINPVIGPEPITGSSRMKGGSTTKIILDTAFIVALSKSCENRDTNIETLLRAYQKSFSYTSQVKKEISRCVENASNCLSSDGHVYYLGFGYLGFYGILDASECVPTFSADFNSIRGFLKDAYEVLGNKEGDLSHVHQHYCISLAYFYRDIMPNLSVRDYVIMFGTEKDASELQSTKMALMKTSCKLTMLLLNIKKTINEGKEVEIPDNTLWKTLMNDKNTVCMNISSNNELPMSLKTCEILTSSIAELFIKRTLNIISTCAHILIGKVVHNYMIDLKVSNEKLLKRAISIVKKFTDVTYEDAKECLLKVIHFPEKQNKVLTSRDSKCVIKLASKMNEVVPTALLIATGRFTIERAREILNNKKTIRKCLIEAIHGI